LLSEPGHACFIDDAPRRAARDSWCLRQAALRAKRSGGLYSRRCPLIKQWAERMQDRRMVGHARPVSRKGSCLEAVRTLDGRKSRLPLFWINHCKPGGAVDADLA
jgi:hypothetical protein